MKAETRNVSFDKDSLPVWARNNEDVVWFAKRNLAFRSNLHAGTSNKQLRKMLVLDAKRIRYAR